MRFESGTIALLQNNPEDTRLLLDAFRRQHSPCALEILTNGEECLEYLAGAGKYQDRGRYPVPSAIVCDLDLPGLSGFDVLTWLRERPEFVTIPVFVLTSSRQPRDLQRAYALGARSYVVKPMTLGVLTSLVQAITGDEEAFRGPGVKQATTSAGRRQAKAGPPDVLKRIVVGSSSESPHIRSQKKYRVRIGNKWFEGAFSKRWFGWLFDDFGDTGMQLNLIDEVFELPPGSSERVASPLGCRPRRSP